MKIITHKSLPIIFLSVITFFGCDTTEKKNDDGRPNIILISADDLGWADLGCYGSQVATPNLDKLAENGMRFTQFHNTSKCFPSRACLLTGVYAQDCGYAETFENEISNAVTIGEVLGEAGYITLWSGKHHGKENPVYRGFDHYYGLKDGACNYFNPGNQKPGEPVPAHKKGRVREWCIDSALYEPYTPEDRDFYTTDYFTKYALQWLDDYKDDERPFFLYMAYTAPHDPLMAWPEDIEKYQGKFDDGYAAIRQARYKKQLEMGLIDSTYRLSEPTYTPWEELSEEEKQFEIDKMEVYAAMIDRLDQNIGNLLAKLKETGRAENTLILFVSDNGASAEVVRNAIGNDSASVGSMARWVSLGPDWANVGNTPFRLYKNYSYEGGINTPLIAYWPGEIEPGSFSAFPGHFIDFMPTFVEMADAQYPENYNGQSIVPYRGESLIPALKGQSTTRKKPLFWEWRDGQAARKDQWKLVRHGLDNEWKLYNMENDPTETNDLSEEHPDKARELLQLFEEWKEQYEGQES